ncbi:MAG: cytochrome c maturation protein CcmE [Thermoplasmata archaeon]
MEEDEEALQKPTSGAKRQMILKIIVVLAIIIVLVVIFLSSTPADPYDSVDKLMSDPERYVNKHVEVRGTVEGWSPADKTFNLTGENASVIINYTVVTDSFANGKDVVVKGDFHHDGSSYLIVANDMIVGCASRY